MEGERKEVWEGRVAYTHTRLGKFNTGRERMAGQDTGGGGGGGRGCELALGALAL